MTDKFGNLPSWGDWRECRRPRHPPFTVFLPFGDRLVYDGEGFHLVRGHGQRDGTFGLVVARDGTIERLEPAPVPAYTPPPCLPAPDPCGDMGEGSAELSTEQGNLLKLDLMGNLLARLHVTGDGVEVSGYGTLDSPLTVKAEAGSSDVHLRSDTPDILGLEGAGTAASSWRLSHLPPAANVAGTHGAFRLDSYGHVTGFVDTDQTVGLITVQALPGTLVVTTEQGAAIVSLPEYFSGEFSFETDRMILTVDMYGRITRVVGRVPSVECGWARTFQGTRSSFGMSVTTTRTGRIRGTYRGGLGVTVPKASETYGLIALPSSVTVTVAGESADAFARVVATDVIGLEFVTPLAYDAGTYEIRVELQNAISVPGIMDVTLCL